MVAHWHNLPLYVYISVQMFSKNHRKGSISMYSITLLFHFFLCSFLINTFSFFIPHFVYFILVFSVDLCPVSFNFMFSFMCVQNLFVFSYIQNNFLSLSVIFPLNLYIIPNLFSSAPVVSYVTICDLHFIYVHLFSYFSLYKFFCLIYSLLLLYFG